MLLLQVSGLVFFSKILANWLACKILILCAMSNAGHARERPHNAGGNIGSRPHTPRTEGGFP